LNPPTPGLEWEMASVLENCLHGMLEAPRFVLIPQRKILFGGASSSWGQSLSLICSASCLEIEAFLQAGPPALGFPKHPPAKGGR
jgi:hypothetical protein